ncbi:MAG: flagellar biosynthesis protein FlhB [Gammaproteobacteria bacterium]|nr:flagellar biosynthesis protein FlhB [Gammaproteobacteria bacterium]
MAEFDGQERTEQPTEKRLSDAKAKGQVARSRDLGTTLVLVSSAIGLLVFGGMIINALAGIMRTSLTLDKSLIFSDTYGIQLFLESIQVALLSLVPLAVIILVASIYGSTALSGWIFSTEALAFNFSKLDPISGIKRMLGLNSLVEAGKAFLKLLLVGSVGIFVLWVNTDEMLGLGKLSLEHAMASSVQVLGWVFLWASLPMILVAAVDAPYQLWSFHKQLRMTHEEIKQEHKETDGSPEIKRKVKQIQQQIAMQRMMQKVPQADVVITNPTHFSVAIKYDQKKMRAPIVVAKGADLVAFEIRRIAQGANVPILSAPPLARSIYHHTELDQAIPEGLYVAVAQVLAYIYHLKKTGFRSSKRELHDLPIPDEYVIPGNTSVAE